MILEGSFVVNCFQFVIWRSLTHHGIRVSQSASGCELLSICDLTIFDTPAPRLSRCAGRLWIAFNLWFDDLWHTLGVFVNFIQCVVNCFQFVIWRSLTHQWSITWFTVSCCELLSICDLTIFDTPVNILRNYPYQLWIAFNLWFDDLWHTRFRQLVPILFVVNCFQFVIWRSLTHHVNF